MKKYFVKVDMTAEMGGEFKEIKEDFNFSNEAAAISFAMGYAEAMNWATATIHDCTFADGYYWTNKKGDIIIKVVDENDNIVEHK